MTFDEWVADQPLQVRRDLYEHTWIKELCRDAFEHGRVFGNKEAYVIQADTYDGLMLCGVALSIPERDRISEAAEKHFGTKYVNHFVEEVELSKFLPGEEVNGI